jgi:hypothetical protein
MNLSAAFNGKNASDDIAASLLQWSAHTASTVLVDAQNATQQ